MAIGGAFLGGGLEVVPAGSCKLELEILTEDRNNLTATFTIRGTSTYTVTAGADGRAVYTVPSGQTYTVSVNTTGYDNIASQTVVAESGTVRYVRFEAFLGRVKRSGDTMTGNLAINTNSPTVYFLAKNIDANAPSTTGTRYAGIGRVEDKSGTDLGRIFVAEQTTDNTIRFSFGTSPRKWGYGIFVEYDINNKVFTKAVTPSDSADNNTNIATTAWVNRASSVVHTDRDEVIQGRKTFSSTLFGPAYVAKSSAQPTPFIDFHYSNSDTFTTRFIQLDGEFRLTGSVPITLGTSLPSTATANEIVTAGWTINKFVQKTGDTMTGELLANGGVRSNFIRKLQSDGQNVAFVLFEETEASNIGSLNARKSTGTNTAVYPSLKLFANSNGTYYATLTSSYVGYDDNSDKVLTIKMANGLPSLVHTDRDETINGLKVFMSEIQVPRNGVNFRLKNTEITRGTIPSTGKWNRIQWADVNNAELGGFQMDYTTSGDTKIRTYLANGTHASWDFGVILKKDGTAYGTAPNTPSNANSNEIATANWVNTKVAQRNKVTNVTSYTQLIELIKNGKRGDSFGLTMDYVGGSIGGIYATDRETHAFGHYTIDEITVSDGALTGLQAFGSGEVSGKLKNDDDTTYVYATSGFGRQELGTGVFDAFRVAEDGKLTYFVANSDGSNISAFEGYYISI